MVGVTHECDHPAAARSLPHLTADVLPAGLSAAGIDEAVRSRTLEGQAIYSLDREALARLEPELIITQALCPVCAVSYDEVAEVAAKLPSKPRVIALDPKTLGETFGDVRTIAQATGTRDAAVELIARAAGRVDRVRLAVRGRRRPRVAAIEWLDPVFAAGHWTPQLIELAGGEDVFGMPGEPSQTITWELVAAAEPEVLILMPCGYDEDRALEEALANLQQIEMTRAGRVFAVNASAYFSRPGPRLVDGLELLGHILHPSAVPEPACGARALSVATRSAAR